ncbi:aminodeoxychorismate lyase [Salinivibrio proteolyticus]|uniref:aminodeoxychorismate lyase n=1 Tax=Salinivibrio proteolyticus TaxID=334715 RepID=UPI0009892CB8|nr:aminodeoxychorismate lyase [Salinivibrio proteolyticus]OOF31652.1 aminodeoxychorismate lyase [Salinivibrio proteolyticus]
MQWVNGQPSATVPISDRGLQFGDGCFTTGQSVQGVLQQADAHFERLMATCQQLAIDGVDWLRLQQTVAHACAQSNQEQVVKIVITRGQGGRGYSPAGCQQPTDIVTLHAFPQHYYQWQQHGISLATTERQLGASPLAGLKHLNRLEQVLLKRELDQRNKLSSATVDDLVVCDLFGNLVETTASNLFWRQGADVYTPALHYAGVDGLMRQRVIAMLEDIPDYHCHVVQQGPDALYQAEEVFITNTLMKVVPVNHIDHISYSDHTLASALQQRLNAC